jgi:hypothetical protein
MCYFIDKNRAKLVIVQRDYNYYRMYVLYQTTVKMILFLSMETCKRLLAGIEICFVEIIDFDQ